MTRLVHTDLMSLEQYARERSRIRAEVIRHKKTRQVALGANMTLLFEDRRTIQMQIQEMLRIEKIFEADAIQDELDAYNPLIPDGSNWKATCLIEFEEENERRQRLTEMCWVEDQIYVQVQDFDRVMAIADEDMDRSNDTKTSAVHFLRFEFSPSMIAAIRAGSHVLVGVDHPSYREEVLLPEPTRLALAEDFG